MTKKITNIVVAVALFGLLSQSAVRAQSCVLSIPTNNTASVSIEATPAWWNSPPGAGGDYSAADNLAYFYDTVISDTAGIAPGFYYGWCIDTMDGLGGAQEIYNAVLYSTCDTNIDTDLPSSYPASVRVSLPVWHQINYLLNHKNGAAWFDIQVALWELMGEPIPPAQLEGNSQNNPNVNWASVTSLTNDAVVNAAGWQFQCGDVIAIVVAVHPNPGDQNVNGGTAVDQLTIIEYPYPCIESVTVNKQIACLQPGNNAGGFGKTAGGFVGTNDPAFCYQVTVNNTGTIPLTNLVVSDSQAGDLTGQFVASSATVLAPGGSLTAYYKKAYAVTTVNTVTVLADASLANTVTYVVNGNTTTIANGQPVSATDQATAVVDTASVVCGVSLTSSLDLNSPPIPGTVQLPSATIFSTPPAVTFSISVTNTGTANLANITLTSSALTALGIIMPAPFPLAAGKSMTFLLGTVSFATCPGLTFSVCTTGQAQADGTHCAVYDLTSTNPIGVSSYCMGSITCAPPTGGGGCGGVAILTGHVYLHCDGTTPVATTDSPLAGVPVILLNTSLALLATTNTDATGSYTFSGLAPGTYIVEVTPPANFVQTYPNGSSTSQIQFTAVACQTAVENFGYADHSPITVLCPPNVTIATNFTSIYCTFTPSDWNSSCNGANTTPSWWVNWDQQNHAINCSASWTNWWTSCTGNNPGNNCWNFCQTPCSGNNNNNNNCNNRWFGGSCNQNTAPSWCSSWNYGNPCTNWWVPCNGYNPGSVLTNCFAAVYSSGCVQVGLPNGNCVKLTSCNAVRQCLGFSGTPGTLNCSAINPPSCTAGSFCAQVLALQLNCDFGDAGASSGFGGPCGDLVLNDATSPCNGQKVRDICKTANCVLGGGKAPSGCTVSYLCGLCSNLNQCFEGCQVSTWCKSHLTPVYIPPPSVTGTATVTGGGCSSSSVLTYCDTVASGACSGSYVITRTWSAVASTGASNYCTQLITITSSPGPSISGTIVNDCAGAGCSSGNNYNNYNWGWNNWGGNSTPSFSGDAGLAGVTVALETSKGVVLTSTVTDTNGNFTFANPGNGNYIVVVTPPAGYSLTYPTSGTANQTSVTITSACQSVTNLLFAYMGNQTGVLLVKTGPATAACGQTITYNFAVTNTGNNCIQLSVIDPLLGGQVFSQNSVAPGQGYTFTQTFTVESSNIGKLTNTAWAVADPAAGPNVTNYSSAVTTVTTKAVTCAVYSSFNSQMPANGWIWCNSHISCNPGKQCEIHCQGATVTITGKSGKIYTCQVPDCDIIFTNNCTVATNCFDGTRWKTILPISGDDEIFLAGCSIPCNSDYASSKTVCWQGTFTCTSPGTTFNWQWGAACYNNNAPQYGSVSVKACHQINCGYNSNGGDHAGTPENCKSSCVGGGTGGGGSNWTGSWSSTGSCSLQSCN